APGYLRLAQGPECLADGPASAPPLRLQRPARRTQRGVDGIQVQRVLQPGGEGRDDPVGVVPGPVEPAVHHPLHAPAQRVEQCGGGQGGGSHRHRVFKVSTWVTSSTSPAYTPASSPVTIAYARVRLMIWSMSYSRYFRMPTRCRAGTR